MVKGVFDELANEKPKNNFTVGIIDDVTNTSLDYDESYNVEKDDVVRAVFYGLGSDGTVGANKNSAKIIGENTDNYTQAYFDYDSKKAGAVTVSYVRFGPRPIHDTYQIDQANFIACHQFQFLERFDMLSKAVPGATFLLNSPFGPDEVWNHLPRSMQEEMIEKKIKFYVVDGYQVAKETGMGRRINTIMQTCFFSLMEQVTGEPLLPKEDAIDEIKTAIKKTYGKRGEQVVLANYAAVDAAVAHMYEVTVPEKATSTFEQRSGCSR